MKKILFLFLTVSLFLPAVNVFAQEGLVTHYLNEAIEKPTYGSKVTKWVSVPKFGGYFIGGYKYSSKEGANGGDGFNARLIRFYVDGSILKDFNYRFQIQFNGSSPHMKDYFIEWARYKEIRAKIGQYKRAFTFENPMNPWDVGTNDYSLLVKNLAGMGDITGEASSCGGRDLGIQLQGDLVPLGEGDKQYRLIHYQAMVANGQGINTTDKNARKDILGTLQFQPIKGLYIGAFGWSGNYVNTDGKVYDRKRWSVGATYSGHDWNVRAEYARSTGHKEKNEKGALAYVNDGRCDAWYATVGVPCTPWMKIWLKYDVMRYDASDWHSMHSIYSISTNFQVHKHLMLAAQYNFNNNRTFTHHNYHDLWGTVYFRF